MKGKRKSLHSSEQAEQDAGKTRFNEYVLRANRLDAAGFEQWVFYPGMLFDSLESWWGTGTSRAKCHEGIDICLFTDTQGHQLRLDHTACIPVMYDGQLVKIADDYIAQSIFVQHDSYDDTGRQLYTVYAHTDPYPQLTEGSMLCEGDIIATIADGVQQKAKMLSHVHVSVAWVPRYVSYEKLTWNTLGDKQIVRLVDPLEVIACRYTTVPFDPSQNPAAVWRQYRSAEF